MPTHTATIRSKRQIKHYGTIKIKIKGDCSARPLWRWLFEAPRSPGAGRRRGCRCGQRAVMAAVVANRHAETAGGGDGTEPKATKDSGSSYAQAATRVSSQELPAVSNGLSDQGGTGSSRGLGLSSNMVRPGSCGGANLPADAPKANPWLKRSDASGAATVGTGKCSRSCQEPCHPRAVCHGAPSAQRSAGAQRWRCFVVTLLLLLDRTCGLV